MEPEKMNRRALKKEILKEMGSRTNIKMCTKNGTLNVNVPVNPDVTLSSLFNAVDTVYQYAELKQNPTVLNIKAKDKAGNEIKLSFPIATMGVRDGKPIYPYYEPAGRALHIASKYPRNTSPNMREITGEYTLTHEADKEFGTAGVKSSAYPNVKVHIKTASGMEYGTDIDVFYVSRDVKGRTIHIVPAEVTTIIDSIARKIRCWGPTTDFVQTLADVEGIRVNVVPAVVYIQKTHNGEALENGDWAGKIDEILRSKFPNFNHKIIGLRSSTAIKDSKCVYQKMDQVEYINAALRNYAILPKKYHSPLTHHTLKHYNNPQILEHRFHESGALRKIWRSQQIPYEVKDNLTNTYKKLQKKGKLHALLRAFDKLDIPVHAGRRHQEVYMMLDGIMHRMVKRFDPSEYKKI